jgi:two-component system sensor histidine kinase QseC
MRRPPGLQRRLTLSLLLVFVAGLAASSLFFYAEAHSTLKAFQKRTLQDQARELLSGFELAPDGSETVAPPPSWLEAYRNPDRKFSYTLFDANRRPVARSPNLEAALPLPDSNEVVHAAGPDRLATLAVPVPNGSILVVARKQADPEALAESLIEENSEHYLVLVPFALAAPILIWWISRWSLRPLARASREAAAIGPSALSARISTAGIPTEIRPLVEAVNGALDRLAEAYAAERRLTADAAHQLRTPVTVLDLRLQRARLDDHVDWPAVAADMRQLRRLLDQLLDLARKDHAARAAGAERVRVNLCRIVRETAAQMLPIAEEAERVIEVEAPDTVEVLGYPDDLRDMVRNLLDNAIIHGRGEVQITVRRRAGNPGDDIAVEVSDEGDGVPTDLREAVFDRFRKAAANSPGAGLGLAVVRQVARHHGGDAHFLPDTRSRIIVILPSHS